MKNRKRIEALLLALAVTAHPVSSIAACFDPSPAALSGKEPIEAITPKPISHQEYELLKDFLTSLPKNWTGSGIRTECMGDAKHVEIQTRHSAINGEITFNSEILSVSLNLDFDDGSFDDISLYELPEFLLTAKSNEDGSVTTQAREVTGNSVEIYFKTSIKLVQSKGVRPMEHLFTMSRKDSTLEIERRIFMSGILVQTDNWKLQAK